MPIPGCGWKRGTKGSWNTGWFFFFLIYSVPVSTYKKQYVRSEHLHYSIKLIHQDNLAGSPYMTVSLWIQLLCSLHLPPSLHE